MRRRGLPTGEMLHEIHAAENVPRAVNCTEELSKSRKAVAAEIQLATKHHFRLYGCRRPVLVGILDIPQSYQK